MKLNVRDFVCHPAFGDINGHLVANFVPEKSLAHGRIDGNRSIGEISLVWSQQSELFFFPGIVAMYRYRFGVLYKHYMRLAER